jgi:hypothetical protein
MAQYVLHRLAYTSGSVGLEMHLHSHSQECTSQKRVVRSEFCSIRCTCLDCTAVLRCSDHDDTDCWNIGLAGHRILPRTAYMYPCCLVGSSWGRQMQFIRSKDLDELYGSGSSHFTDQTLRTVFQPNCEWFTTLLILAGNRKLTCSIFDCCHAHMRFWINFRVINVLKIIIIKIISNLGQNENLILVCRPRSCFLD